jgi:tetratricopeptide (TPR) repeat protein
MAQQTGAVFQKCIEYATQVDQLNDVFARQQAAVEKVVGSIRELQPRIEQTELKFKQLVEQRAQIGFQREMVDARSLSLLYEFNTKTGNSGNLSRKETADTVTQLGVQADFMLHHMRTLDQAGRIAMQQRVNLLQQVQTLLEEYGQYHGEQLELFDKYWELADVTGERSDLERKAARRALDRADDKNPGAMFLQAMLAMRSNELDEANLCLNELGKFEEVQYVVLAARGELEARQGKTEEALRSLKNAARSRNDMRVRIHRAVVLGSLARYREAENEWEFVLENGKHDIKARCAISMLNALAVNPSDKQKSKALENAKAASRLAGQDNWSCSVAVALAHAANDQPDEAKSAAEEALTHAIGSQRTRCVELIDRLSGNAKPLWTLTP